MSAATRTRTYTTTEVCEMVGCTYRVLDYALRTGAVKIAHDVDGSGLRRMWTAAEVRRLERVLAAYNKAVQITEDFRTGKLWDDTP